MALLGVLLFFLLRRRKNPSPPSSFNDPMMGSQNPASFGAFPYQSNAASPAPYPSAGSPILNPSTTATTGSSGPYGPPPVPGSPPMFPLNYPTQAPTSVDGTQLYPATYANQVPTNYTGTSATSGGQVRSHYNGVPEL